MKLISFYHGKKAYAGVAVGGYAVDISRAAKALGGGTVPGSIKQILEGGAPMMGRVRRGFRRIESKLDRVTNKKERRPPWAWPLEDVELTAPVPDPEKVICIGQNYIDHCREQGLEPPKRPIIFAKFPTTLTGPSAKIKLPPTKVTSKVDYEVELAFVIGREGKKIKRKDAMDHVAGYMVLNDISARDIQYSDKQWVRAKSFDTFAPCGPWLITPDEVANPHDLRIRLKLNGEVMQDSSTKNLIFKIPFLIEYISKGITLRPGDIISTGTPPGVGIFRDPQVVLKPGDTLEAGIEEVGILQNKCVRDR